MSEPREIQVFQMVGPGRPGSIPGLVTRDWRPGLTKTDETDSRHPAGREMAADEAAGVDSGPETALSGTSVPLKPATGLLMGVPESDIPAFEPESDITPSIV